LTLQAQVRSNWGKIRGSCEV